MVCSLLGLLPPPQNVVEDTCWPFPGFRGSGSSGALRFRWGVSGPLPYTDRSGVTEIGR